MGEIRQKLTDRNVSMFISIKTHNQAVEIGRIAVRTIDDRWDGGDTSAVTPSILILSWTRPPPVTTSSTTMSFSQV